MNKPRRRVRRSVDSVPRWTVTFIRKSEDATHYHSYRLRNDMVIFVVMGKSVEEAIQSAEEKFETLCGSGARCGFIIERLEHE